MRVLISCPPMLRMIKSFEHFFSEKGIEIHCPNVVQTLSENELKDLVPQYQGWIIGDDPATREVFEAGKKGCLRAAVKWGIGIDNIDFKAAKDFGIPISNVPNMFGKEVADLAMSYITGLARESFFIDREVRSGKWPKPCGISLADKRVALVGYGDIGKNLAKRMLASDMHVTVYDPAFESHNFSGEIQYAKWPDKIEEADFVVFTCSLTRDNYHMFNPDVLSKVRKGVRVVNVARGPLIKEDVLIKGLRSGIIHSAALDVMEVEPLPMDSPLKTMIIPLKFEDHLAPGIGARHTNGVHGGFGSGAGQARHLQAGNHLDHHLFDFDLKFTRHSKKDTLADFFHNLGVHFIYSVTQNDRPKGHAIINILVAIHIPQVTILAFLDIGGYSFSPVAKVGINAQGGDIESPLLEGLAFAEVFHEVLLLVIVLINRFRQFPQEFSTDKRPSAPKVQWM